MNGSTVIDEPTFKISSPKNELVEELLFRDNKQISHLPIETYTKFPNLIVLDASRCSIKAVKKENFQNLLLLKEIYLSDTRIETIKGKVFEGLVALEIIHLGKT